MGILDLKDNAAMRIQRSFRRWRVERTGGEGDKEKAASRRKKGGRGKKQKLNNNTNSSKPTKKQKKKKPEEKDSADKLRKYSTVEQVTAAVRIQAHIRGYKTRKEFKQLQSTSMRGKDKVAAAVQAASGVGYFLHQACRPISVARYLLLPSAWSEVVPVCVCAFIYTRYV